jgi:outer membrane protein assembly factor BamB
MLALWLALLPAALRAEWPTFRGNNARTGCVDDQPGPQSPAVLWSYQPKSPRDNFVGSPAVTDGGLYVASLGAFNTGSLSALDLASAEKRLAWAKTPPLLKLPTVSSPSISEGVLYFGDGMHQTSGASLYAVSAESGTLMWTHAVRGELVHMEGAPTVAAGRVYLGAGHGGVLCLDASKLSLEGKELSSAEIRKQLEARWKKLLADYEVEKKTDPDFAFPPTEDALPKATPKLVWQKGVQAWHVDAPVALAGDKLLAASAYLETENSGERALLCLDAKTGETLWKTPLELNPWAGATVVGDVAILGGSNIRLEPKDIPKARGSLTAINLLDGNIKWNKKLPGGIVSSVAVKGSLVVATGTDGLVRAHDLTSGDEKWTYAAHAPLFAGPAIAGDMVYAGDL